MPRDIVERLRDRAYSGLPDPLLAEAANEIDRLRNGAVSGRETVPDPDSRVWETPCTPQPHAIPAKGSAQGDGSVRDSRNANEPVAFAVCIPLGGKRYAVDDFFMSYGEAQKACDWRIKNTQRGAEIVPVYRQPQPTLTDAEREAVESVLDDPDLVLGDAREPLRGLLERLG